MNFNFKKTTILLALAFAVVACKNDVADVNGKGDSASFEFSKIEVVSTDVIASNPNWPDLKDKMIVSLRTCFTDKVYLEKVVGEDFLITSDIDEREQTTNANGCLSWSEEIEFNYLQNETYFQISGDIEGVGNLKGVQEFNIGLNPWKEKVVDLGHARVPKLVHASSGIKTLAKKNYIKLDTFTAVVKKKEFYQDETKLEIEVSTEPQVTRRGLNHEVLDNKLSGGEFEVQYFLVSKNLDNDHRKIVSSYTTTSNVRRDGYLKTRVKFELDEEIPANSVVELGVLLKSADSSMNLGAAEGIIPIKTLKGTFSGKLVDINIPFTQIRAAASGLEENAKSNPDAFGFAMDYIQAEMGTYGRSNVNALDVEKEVVAKFRIKMVDSLVRQEILGQSFKVVVYEKDTNSVIFEDDSVNTEIGSGILKFRAVVPFRADQRRDWKEYMVRISSSNSPYHNIIKERLVYINPNISGSDFLIDSKDGNRPPEVAVDTSPKIALNKIDFKFLGNSTDSFKINKSLDMMYERSLRFDFVAKVDSNHRYEGNKGDLPKIKDGKFKMKVLILAPNSSAKVDYTRKLDLSDFYVLTGAEQVFEADSETKDSGILSTSFNFPIAFGDLPYFGVKNIALVEMISLDEGSDLQPGYLLGEILTEEKNSQIVSVIDQDHTLAQSSSYISNLMDKSIKSLGSKIDDDYQLADSFITFKKMIEKTDVKVPVFNANNFKLEQKQIDLKVYSSVREFAKVENVELPIRALKKLIYRPDEVSAEQADELCNLFYKRNTVMEQWHQHPGDGLSRGFTQLHKIVGYEYKKCIKNPAAFLHLKKLEHVRKITEQPTKVDIQPLDIGSSTAYFVSDGTQWSKVTGQRKDEYLTMSQTGSFNLLGAISGGMLSLGGYYENGTRVGTYVGDDVANLTSNLTRAIYKAGVDYSADVYTAHFRADVKSCVLISAKYRREEVPKEIINYGLYSLFRKPKVVEKDLTSNKRFYVCIEGTSEVGRKESWYYVKLNSKSKTGDNDLRKNILVDLVRGKQNFEAYKKDRIDLDKKAIFRYSENEESIAEYEKNGVKGSGPIKYKAQSAAGFPGLLE